MPSPSGKSAIDLDHLAHQTFGNRDLEREVLGLFLKQSERFLVLLADPAPDYAAAAHAILGSARGIGAHEVARAAEALENTALRALAPSREEIESLRSAIGRANDFIRMTLKSDD